MLLGRAAWKWKRSAPGLAVATVLVMGPILIALLASPNQPRLSHGFLVVPLLGLILALQVMCQERKSVAKPIGVGVLILGFMSATRVGVWESDLTLFEASHALESDDAEVRLNLARTVVLGDPKRSVLLLEGVVGFSPRRKREAAAVRAQALLKLGEAEQAVEWLRIAAGSDTESAWATGTLCVLLAGSPDAESEDICRGAVDLLPDDADVANALGIVYARKGELNSAATWFGRALEIAPQRAAFRANLEAAHLASQRQ